jgi:peptide/nickel transport system substrate-binding protein
MQGPTPRHSAVGRIGRGVAIAAALSVAVAGTAATVTAQDDLDVLNVAHTATVTTWDPVASFSTEAQYLANMYEPLLYATPAGAEEDFAPGLAKAWSVSDDGLTWTFELEEGVTFHDGEPFNAEAAKASIEAASDPEGRAGAWWIWPGIESIETPDEYTLVVNLTSPAALDLVAASTYAAWMVSPVALAAAEEDPTFFETAGASFGTGPYMLESHTPGTEVLLTQFPDYRKGWDDADHYEKVLVQILDAVNQQQALEGGDVLAANRIPPESVDEIDASDQFTVHSDPSLFNYVGLLNTQRAPLDNKLVRQALAYATPYDDIIEVATRGEAVQDRAAVPQGVFPYSDDVPQYSFDMDKAKELMAEAGVDGFDLEITYAAENPVHAAYAPLLQATWAELGVDVTITPMPWPQQWERSKGEPEGRQDLFLLLYWPTYSDAGSDNLASLFKSGEPPFFNLSYWVNEEFDGLIDQAIGETGVDREAAQATYEQAMDLLVEESPGLFFLDTNSVVAVSNELAGYEYNLNYPFTQFFFYDLIPAA